MAVVEVAVVPVTVAVVVVVEAVEVEAAAVAERITTVPMVVSNNNNAHTIA